ncbi:MAG: transcriptional regulator, partial [Alphaproteobacteria bacterium]|nr:transcriptional regulator [Alphaproteobacteria bacterium]
MAEYRYTACGLPNVIVDGIERRVDEDGDEIVSIPNVNSLHRVIAAALVEKPSALT